MDFTSDLDALINSSLTLRVKNLFLGVVEKSQLFTHTGHDFSKGVNWQRDKIWLKLEKCHKNGAPGEIPRRI